MRDPYKSFKDLSLAIYNTAKLRFAENNNRKEFLPQQLEFLSQFKPFLAKTKGPEPVLTLLNAKFQNIIVQPVKGDGEKIKD